MENISQEQKVITIRQWLGSGTVNIFGMLLSGKDTQGQLLAHSLGGNVISGGDILRNSEIPERARKAQEAGNLIDTEDYLQIVTPYLSQAKFEGQPLILSAVGRWIGEEQAIIQATKQANHPTKVVAYIHIDQQTAFDRLGEAKRNRPDDNEQILKKRIEEFENKTLPVIEIYRKMGLLVEVNGMQTRDEVYKSMVNALFEKATS